MENKEMEKGWYRIWAWCEECKVAFETEAYIDEHGNIEIDDKKEHEGHVVYVDDIVEKI